MRTKYIEPQVNTAGLVAHYKLNKGLTGTAQVFDYSPNGNVGTVSADGAFPQYPGIYFEGAVFPATEGKITVTDTDDLSFEAGTQDFSISAWAKFPAAVAIYTVLDKRDGVDDGWRLVNVNTVIWLQIDAIDIGKAVVGVSAVPIADTLWHHIGATVDRDGNGQIYIDSVASGDATAISGEAMDIANADFTMAYVVEDSYTEVTIGDIMIFDILKSATEIKDIYELTRRNYNV